MKKLLFVALMLTLAAASFASDKPCHGGCPCKMEGVTRSVENLGDGVKVTLSAKDPKLVAMIQEKVGKREEGDCPMMSENVNRSVETTSDGIVMTLTSGDAEMVKKLQSHAAAEAKGHDCAGHRAKMDCQHKQEDCPHHK